MKELSLLHSKIWILIRSSINEASVLGSSDSNSVTRYYLTRTLMVKIVYLNRRWMLTGLEWVHLLVMHPLNRGSHIQIWGLSPITKIVHQILYLCTQVKVTFSQLPLQLVIAARSTFVKIGVFLSVWTERLVTQVKTVAHVTYFLTVWASFEWAH